MKSLGDRIRHKSLPFGTTGSYQIVNGSLTSIPDNVQNYLKNGYDINDIVYSIVNLIVEKVRVAPWALYDIVDDSSLKQYKALQLKKDFTPEDFRRAKDLRHKAFQPAKNPGKIGELIKYPNEYETFQDFIANGCGYKLLTGNKFIWADVLDMGANKGMPQSLWLLPSQYMQVYATRDFPSKVTGYRMLIIGDHTYSTEEICHEKYMNYDWSVNGTQHYGVAPLKAALRLTNRNNSAIDTTTAKFQNGGLESVIYVDDQRLSGEQANAQATALKAKLVSEYTGSNNWGKIAASGYKVGVANLGLSPVELAIIDAEKWDLRRFCNVFGGVPSQLLNDPDNKSYNNQKEGEKALTARCALPLLTSARDNLNRKFQSDWGLKPNQIIDFDMTVYSELQETVGETMRWLDPLMNHGLPLNRALDVLNMEKIEEPEADAMWVTPAMGTPLSDWRLNEVDNSLNNDGVDSNIP